MVSSSLPLGSGTHAQLLDQVAGLVVVRVLVEVGDLGLVGVEELGVAEPAVGERVVDLLLAAELGHTHSPW